MDSFFGIGLPELILILLLAGMVMGPHRIRFIARKLGRITANLQGISRQFARQLNAELDSVEGNEVTGAWDELRQLQKEVQSLRDELGQGSRSLVSDSKNVIDESQKAMVAEQAQTNTAEPPVETADGGDQISLPNALVVPDDTE